MPRYRVVGCIQGRGMDADKFYNVVREYEAADIKEAEQKASDDKV